MTLSTCDLLLLLVPVLSLFKFLLGTHHMDRPLIIGNVQNLSLESYSSKQTRLVAHFAYDSEALFAYDSEVTSCVYTMLGLDGENVTACPALGLYNMYLVTFTGINVTVQCSHQRFQD